MARGEKLQCVVIGEGSLPIICGEILRQRGHEILALVSPDSSVARWGSANGIAHVGNPSQLAAMINGAPFDYLFSIVNFQKVPARVLSAARRYAINYHDAPLPRYAGMHATSWALLHGETHYAVTWHVMTSRIDAGDILKQVPVEIEPDDTALSLNAKCFEAAVTGFLALLDDIESGAVDPCPQNLVERSFFRLSQRPTIGCTLPFDAPAEHLYALLRALDFGPYFNPLGLPKIALGASFAIVTELEVLDGRSGDVPGTIVEVTAERLVATTASDDVALAGFLTIDGVPMTVADVVHRGGLRIGARVGAVEEERAARLIALCEGLSTHEPFWLAELAQAQPTLLPYAVGSAGPSRRIATHTLTMDDDGMSPATTVVRYGGDSLLTAFVMYLARLADTGSVNIGFSDTRVYTDIGDLHPFFSTCLPLRVSTESDARFEQFSHAIRSQLERVRAHRSYARDAPLRDPVLRAKSDAVEPSVWPIGVEILEGGHQTHDAPLPPGRVLTARLGGDGKACTFLYDPSVLDPVLVEGMSRQFLAFLRVLSSCSEQFIRVLPPL